MGGSSHYGVVFKVNVDGSGFTNIHSFSIYEGGWPIGRLTISGNTLYGTTESHLVGSALFKVNTDGSGFAILSGADNPGLALLGNALYGTIADWDSPQRNFVYKINVDGSGFAIAYNFANTAIPQGDLISSAGIVYGTTYAGGTGGGGTVFALNPAILLRSAVLNDKIVLSWYDASFQLQSAPIVSGPYTNIPGATSPYTNAATSPQQFFRLQQ